CAHGSMPSRCSLISPQETVHLCTNDRASGESLRKSMVDPLARSPNSTRRMVAVCAFRTLFGDRVAARLLGKSQGRGEVARRPGLHASTRLARAAPRPMTDQKIETGAAIRGRAGSARDTGDRPPVDCGDDT